MRKVHLARASRGDQFEDPQPQSRTQIPHQQPQQSSSSTAAADTLRLSLADDFLCLGLGPQPSSNNLNAAFRRAKRHSPYHRLADDDRVGRLFPPSNTSNISSVPPTALPSVYSSSHDRKRPPPSPSDAHETASSKFPRQRDASNPPSDNTTILVAPLQTRIKQEPLDSQVIILPPITANPISRNPQQDRQIQPASVVYSNATVVTHDTASTAESTAVSSAPSIQTFHQTPISTHPDPSTSNPPSITPIPQTPTTLGRENPKATLYTYLNKPPQRIVVSNNHYISWDNGARPHEVKFTAVLVHPTTGEIFTATRLATTEQQQQGRVPGLPQSSFPVWYGTKKMAEHGAAARALDCLYFRVPQSLNSSDTKKGSSSSILTQPKFFGQDEPYVAGHCPPAFACQEALVPPAQRALIQAAVRKARQQADDQSRIPPTQPATSATVIEPEHVSVSQQAPTLQQPPPPPPPPVHHRNNNYASHTTAIRPPNNNNQYGRRMMANHSYTPPMPNHVRSMGYQQPHTEGGPPNLRSYYHFDPQQPSQSQRQQHQTHNHDSDRFRNYQGPTDQRRGGRS